MIKLTRLVKGIARHGSDLLSLERMNEAFHMLALHYIFLMFYYTLESVFVNTLLYRITPDISIVILYRVLVYAFGAVGTNIAARLAHTRSPVALIRMGSILYILMYMALFFGMNHMQWMMYPVAVLSGLGGGVYWTGHNVLITHYTNRQNRNIGIGVLGIIQGVTTLLVPVVSGCIIQLMPDVAGYRAIFGVAIAVILWQLSFVSRLPQVQQHKQASQLRLACKLLVRKASCKLMLAFEFFRGFRDGTFVFFLNMLLFKIVADESLVGLNTFLTGALSIAGSWVYGRFAQPRLRARYAVLATTILLGFCALLSMWLAVWSIMLFACINAFFQIFIVYTCNNYSYDVVGQNQTTREAMAELMGFRDIAINTGRILGLVCVLAFPDTDAGRVQAMLVLTAAQYITGALFAITQRTLDHKNKRKSRKGAPQSV